MSRTVQKRNGLFVRSGGYFFLYGRDYTNDSRVWTASLGSNGYRFNQMRPENVFVRTPAEQILWQPANDRFDVKPSDWARRWLDTNAPDWDHQDTIEPMFAEFLFTRRSHALALSKAIDEILDGVRIEKPETL